MPARALVPALLILSLLLLGACQPPMGRAEALVQADYSSGELSAAPSEVAASGEPGLRQIGPAGRGGALLYVPASVRPGTPAPLLVMLHGAGGSASHSIDLVRSHADRLGFILLAPGSIGSSWDIISSRDYGPDVRPLDAALKQVFEEYAVDPERVAIGGFSDGASYALSLGIINGQLFRHILAFSPGFMAPTRKEGRPRIFISHGVKDQILPIDACSRRLVPRLKASGYAVDYVEFPGGHIVPDDLARRAYAQFAGS